METWVVTAEQEVPHSLDSESIVASGVFADAQGGMLTRLALQSYNRRYQAGTPWTPTAPFVLCAVLSAFVAS